MRFGVCWHVTVSLHDEVLVKHDWQEDNENQQQTLCYITERPNAEPSLELHKRFTAGRPAACLLTDCGRLGDKTPSLDTFMLGFFNFHKFHVKTFQDIKSTHVFSLRYFSCRGGKAARTRSPTWDRVTRDTEIIKT